MMLSKKNTIEIPEYKHYSYLRLINFLIIGIIGIIIIGSIFFIYNNIYIVIDQTQAFVNLDKNLTIEIIDFTKYEQVDKTWQDRYSEGELVITRDPFNAVVKDVETK